MSVSSDWESIHFDGDQLREQGEDGTPQRVVVVEIPDGVPLRDPSSSASGTAGNRHESSSMTSSARLAKGMGEMDIASTSGAPSETSSFVDVTASRSGAYRSRASDSSSVSESTCSFSWTNVPRGIGPEDHSSASSVISNFDILTVSGGIVHRCKKCSYHNAEDAKICEQCSHALIANPCVDLDLQIAMNLQMKEERESFQQTVAQERKRKNSQNLPLFDQAKMLMNDASNAVRQIGEPFRVMEDEGVAGRFTMITANFIGTVRNLGYSGTYSLKYMVTPQDRWIHTRMQGKELYEFGEDVGTAMKLFNQPGMRRRESTLFSIPEHQDPNAPLSVTGRCWIVAVAEGDKLPKSPVFLDDRQDKTIVGHKAWSVEDASQILPLASFLAPEAAREEDLTRAVSILKRVCEDFFFNHPIEDDDRNLALALERSLNEGTVDAVSPQKRAKLDEGEKNSGPSNGYEGVAKQEEAKAWTATAAEIGVTLKTLEEHGT